MNDPMPDTPITEDEMNGPKEEMNEEEREASVEMGTEVNDCITKGLEHYRDGRFKEALVHFQQALSEDPDNPNILFNLAMCYMKGQSYSSHSELMSIFDHILAIDPDYRDAWANKGSYLAACGNLVDALHCLNKAVEIDGDADILENRGNVYLELGNYQKALDDFKLCTQYTEPKPAMVYNMGIALLELQQYKEALICFDELMDMDYRKIEVMTGKAEILLDMGDIDETIDICDEVISYEPDNIRAKGLKGIALQFSGKSGAARKELEEVRTIVRKKGMKETQLMRILEKTLETMD